MKALEIREPAPLSVAQNLRGLWTEMRPREWSKNLLVFSGVIFSRSLTEPNDLRLTVLGFLVFCSAASGIYIFNDLCDLAADREHPTKKNRPLASGSLNVNFGRVAMTALLVTAMLGSLALSYSFAVVIAVYLLTCIGYSLRLKEVVILDVIIIASGFVLRAVAGAVLIGVSASEWLVLCTSMVALLIGFGKRRHELILLESKAEGHRKNLGDYSLPFLDALMNICAAAAVITYSLYTRADETVARVGSTAMLLTIPFVVYGVFRYLFLIHKRQVGGDPVQILFSDRATQLNLVLWISAAAIVIYIPRIWHF